MRTVISGDSVEKLACPTAARTYYQVAGIRHEGVNHGTDSGSPRCVLGTIDNENPPTSSRGWGVRDPGDETTRQPGHNGTSPATTPSPGGGGLPCWPAVLPTRLDAPRVAGLRRRPLRAGHSSAETDKCPIDL